MVDCVSVIHAFESGALDLHDFYFTGDDYRYRFEADAKQRFIDLIREQFNAGVAYKGRVLKWDTIIEQKTGELGRYLTGISSSIDFIEPIPRLETRNHRELRDKILALTAPQAKQLGIGKSTLHYLRQRAQSQTSLKIFRKVKDRLS